MNQRHAQGSFVALLVLSLIAFHFLITLFAAYFPAYDPADAWSLFYAVALLGLFALADSAFMIGWRKIDYVFIVIIGACSFILGPLYFINPSYDKVLHFVQPVMVTSMIFYLVDRLTLALRWKLFFTFFILAGLIGMFEVGEFILDKLFDLKLQGVFLRMLDQPGLSTVMDTTADTHLDLFFGYLGSLAYLVGKKLQLLYR